MIAARAVCVHSLDQARAAVECAAGLHRPVVLLSGPGAAGYAGCGWWRALIEAATLGRDAAMWSDLLDCGDSAGYAMAALRVGQRGVILAPETPALPAVRAASLVLGATLLTERPAALDLAQPSAARTLPGWLHQSAPSPF
jgi:hypothetical protein